MISKRVIASFLERDLADSSRAKLFTDAALDAKLEAVGYRKAPGAPPLRTHQKVAFLLGLQYDGYLMFLDPGLGKTRVSLDLIRHLITTGKNKRFLVQVPNTGNVQGWLDEAAIHAPDLKVVGVLGERSKREAILGDETADVVVITYAGWLSFICRRKTQDDVEHDAEAKGYIVDEKVARKWEKQFDGVIWDESTTLMNHTSWYARAARRLMKTCTRRYGLTGTPFGKDPEALWFQFYAVDKGETLGETLGLFRGAFFIEKKDYWAGKVWVFDKTKQQLLNRFIRNRSIRYEAAECLDLPKLTRYSKRVVFSDETWKYYERLIEDLKRAEGNFQLIDNVFTQLRYLTSGYLTVKDPEGDTQQVTFKENPKLDALLEYINEIPQDSKIIIFHEYIRTGDIITDALTKLKMKPLRLYSKTKRKEDVVKAFRDPSKNRILVSSSSGAYGHNFQIANYALFYETPTSPIVRTQMIDRCYRSGQTKPVFCVDFVVKNSIDEKVLKSLEEGKDLFKEIIEGRSSLY